jgi:hypothetical protein
MSAPPGVGVYPQSASAVPAPPQSGTLPVGSVPGTYPTPYPPYHYAPAPQIINNITVMAMAPPTPAVVVVAGQAGGPNLLVRALWFLFIGLWLGPLWLVVAWLLLLSIIGLPLGLLMINRLPQVMTLKPLGSWTTVTVQKSLFMLPDVAMIRAKLEVLQRHCDEVGRPYDEIERTTLGTVHIAPGAMAASQVMETCRDLAGIGIQHAFFNMPNVHDIAPLEVFGREIIPAVAGL